MRTGPYKQTSILVPAGGSIDAADPEHRASYGAESSYGCGELLIRPCIAAFHVSKGRGPIAAGGSDSQGSCAEQRAGARRQCAIR